MKFIEHIFVSNIIYIFIVMDSCYAINCDVMQTTGSNFSEFNQVIKSTFITEFDIWIKPELTFNYIKFVINTSSLTISSNHFTMEEWNHIYVKTWYSYQRSWDQCMSAAIVNDKAVFTQLLNCPAELKLLYDVIQKNVIVSGRARISFNCNPKLQNSVVSNKEEGLFASAQQLKVLAADKSSHPVDASQSAIIGVVVPFSILVIGLLLILFYIMWHYKGRLAALEKHQSNKALIDISQRNMMTDDNNYEEMPVLQILPTKNPSSIEVTEDTKIAS